MKENNRDHVVSLGNRIFSNELSATINLPVIVKEAGSGLTADAAIALESAGVEAIDVGGAGGTSWAKVEHFRGSTTAEHFLEWGIPTAESLVECAQAVNIPIIGSGGIRNGVEIVKAIALGACLSGMALPFLRPATISVQAVVEKIESLRMGFIIFGTPPMPMDDARAKPVKL